MNNINYRILDNYKNSTFFNDVFMNQINNIIKKYTENNIVLTKNIKPDQHKEQKRIIITNNIIPLSYLIYGYIYTKFYNFQLRKETFLMNNFNYEMYKFIFNHKNPIIKKVNVFFYNEFEKVKNTKNNISKNSLIKNIINENNNIIQFIALLENLLKKENNNPFYINICDNILKDIISIENILESLKPLFEQIINILKGLSDKSSVELIDILNYLMKNEASNTKTNTNTKTKKIYYYQNIFNIIYTLNDENKLLIKFQYENIFKIYLYNILPIIEKINMNIIQIKDNNIFNNIIKYDEFNLSNLSNCKNFINNKKNDYQKINIEMNDKINLLIDIKNNIDDQNDLYTDLPKKEENNNPFFNELIKYNINIKSKILELFVILFNDNLEYFESNKFTSNEGKNINSPIFGNWLTTIDKIKSLSPIKNYYSMFIILFLFILYIYQKIENEYIYTLFNKKQNNIIFDIEIDYKNNIKSILFFYNTILREYKKYYKNSSDSDFVEYLNTFQKNLENYKNKIDITSKVVNINKNKKNYNAERNITQEKINTKVILKDKISTNINDLKEYKLKIDKTLANNSELFTIYKSIISDIFLKLTYNQIIEIINELISGSFNIQIKTLNENIFSKLNITSTILSLYSKNFNSTQKLNIDDIKSKLKVIKEKLDKNLDNKSKEIIDKEEDIKTLENSISNQKTILNSIINNGTSKSKTNKITQENQLKKLKDNLKIEQKNLDTLNNELNIIQNNINTVIKNIQNTNNKINLGEIYKYLLENSSTKDIINQQILNIFKLITNEEEKQNISEKILVTILTNLNFNKLYLLLLDYKEKSKKTFTLIYPYSNLDKLIEYNQELIDQYNKNIKFSQNSIKKLDKNKTIITDLYISINTNKTAYIDLLNTFILELNTKASNIINILEGKIIESIPKQPITVKSKSTISSVNLDRLNQLSNNKISNQQYTLLYTFIETLLNTVNISKKTNNFIKLNSDNMLQTINTLFDTLTTVNKNQVNNYILDNLYTALDKLTITNLINEYTIQNKLIAPNFTDFIIFKKIDTIQNYFKEKIKNSNLISNISISSKINNNINIISFNENFLSYQNEISTIVTNLYEENNKIGFLNNKNKLYFLMKIDTKLNNCIDQIKNIENIEIIKITNNISDYFSNLKNNNNNFISQLNQYNYLNNMINNKLNKNKVLKSFSDEYINYNKELNTKINNLLKNINKKKYSLIQKYNQKPVKETFNEIILPKLQKIKSIDQNKDGSIINNNNNNNSNSKLKANIIKVLPFTDIMFKYLIYLLIIIDFLSFFYE